MSRQVDFFERDGSNNFVHFLLPIVGEEKVGLTSVQKIIPLFVGALIVSFDV